MPQLDILNSSISKVTTAPCSVGAPCYKVVMQIKDLSLAPTPVVNPGDDPDLDLVWHTQWFVPSTSDPNGGKDFHAYAESTNGGALNCFVGENDVQLVGGGGVLTYPGDTALPPANCQSTLGPNGNITLYVPLSNVTEANPIDNRLHEVTASTMTLQAPANSVPRDSNTGFGGVFFNLIDVAQGYVFDPLLVSAVSRKTHGLAGSFDVDLIPPSPGIECRTGGASGNHHLVVTFASPITFTGVTTACGSVSGTSNVGSQLTIDLTGVPNPSRCSVTIQGVTDGISAARDITVAANFLAGDTNADGFTDAIDTSQTKSQSGNAVTDTNFREDVNVDGFIDAVDASLVKSKSGTALP
jgi:dockerin type I repeat protein